MGKTEQLLLTDRKTNIGENTPAPKTENCSTNITTLSNSNKLYVDIFFSFLPWGMSVNRRSSVSQ